MFIEKRKSGKSEKIYLVHSFRIGSKVKRLSIYLGVNLSQKQITELRPAAERDLLQKIREAMLYDFELSEAELKQLQRIKSDFKISHLQIDWNRFTEDFTYNTNAIEGSAVREDEVHDLLDKKKVPENNDEQEALNVSEAVEYIRDSRQAVSLNFIKNLHEICFRNTKPFAGKLRSVEVVIRAADGSVVHEGAPSEEVPELLKKLAQWYNKQKTKNPPLLLATLVHNEFEHIHPFQDGNGRVGRLLLNKVLLDFGYPPINITLKERQRYYKSLNLYDKTANIKPMLRLLLKLLKEQYKIKVSTKE